MLAKRYRIPWQLRGPSNGPEVGKPLLWRNMEWRPKAKKWMARGGKHLDERAGKYGKGKGKITKDA